MSHAQIKRDVLKSRVMDEIHSIAILIDTEIERTIKSLTNTYRVAPRKIFGKTYRAGVKYTEKEARDHWFWINLPNIPRYSADRLHALLAMADNSDGKHVFLDKDDFGLLFDGYHTSERLGVWYVE